MALNFECGKDVVEKVMDIMKKRGSISMDAAFNYKAQNGLRKEVSYRDIDFLRCLSDSAEIEVVDSIIDYLEKIKIIDHDCNYDKESFSGLKEIVSDKFIVPSTAITPLMARLLYMLSSVKKPDFLLAIGISYGYTFVWNVGPAAMNQQKAPGKMMGIDIDSKSVEIAKKNFSNFKNHANIDVIAQDGLKTLDEITQKIDYLYLDADNMEIGKGLYLELLRKAYPKLAKGAWVLAHDVTFYFFTEQLKEYLEFVRNKKYFSESICLDVDPYGLELSVK